MENACIDFVQLYVVVAQGSICPVLSGGGGIINDIFQFVSDCELYNYAVDITLSNSNNNIYAMTKTLESKC